MMEEIIKSAEKYIEENSEVDLDKLEEFLKGIYDEKDVDEYFAQLGEIFSVIQDYYEDPLDLFMNEEKDNQ
ncbi:hypothetical protein [Petrotoga olearia]|nr:hypothetical protein [Petrotoga olearia]